MSMTDTSYPSMAGLTRPSAARSRPFPVSRHSPFADGYDIASERVALRDLVEADDVDASDPRYGRYVELERREAEFQRLKSSHRAVDGAEPVVPYAEALGVREMGKLTDEGEDSMQLHTREASRLFIGRVKQPGEQGYGQSGGKKVGASLRALWYLSGNDNPYADHALIEAHGAIEAAMAQLEGAITEMEGRLQKLQRRGLSFSVVRAEPPAKVELGFRSPYGYAVVHLISTFDFFVRMVKTLVRKDMLSDKDGYTQIFEKTRTCRRIFERVVWYQRYLMKEELRALSRSDWLPGADETCGKRVKAAVALFGELPREVFTGALAPRHSRRQLDISAEELRLLNELPLAGNDQSLEAATALLQ